MPLPKPSNFIEDIVYEDLSKGRADHIITRYPPEPNGWLHIGHAKAICINGGIAQKYGGTFNLRFDDTNPSREEQSFVDGIMGDIRWLGFAWEGEALFGSSYFQRCYELAELLIRQGDAFVCDLSAEEVRATRGTLTSPGQNSPFRERSPEENLALFRRMRSGELPNGACVLRAKIDMASPNMNMRDPAIYRILHAAHHQTGDAWCIYPMYDFAHPIQDAVEGITHSLCSLEFEGHRPLYDWVVDQCGLRTAGGYPRQIEFARLNITHTVLSKRYLRTLVETQLVAGWDDPRMPTIAGMRRRGFRAHAIRDFVARAGVAKADSVVDVALLEHCVREQLNEEAPRAMAILRPLKVTLTNWPEDQTDVLTIEKHPNHPEMGSYTTPFTRTIYVEQEDFMQDPPGKFFRLKPGGEVRLKSAYIIKCEEAITDASGQVTELLCSVDTSSRSGSPGADRKVKGTLHWLSAQAAVPAEFRLYAYMLKDEDAVAADESGEAVDKKDYVALFNHDSIEVLKGFVPPHVAAAEALDVLQFMRQGYYCVDADATPDAPVFNRTVSLKDSFSKTLKS